MLPNNDDNYSGLYNKGVYANQTLTNVNLVLFLVIRHAIK